jgi:endoglucanase
MGRRRVFAATAVVLTALATVWAGIALQSASAETAAKPFAAPAGSPVAINGQLRVCGVNLCNQAGTPIQLRGMSSNGLQFFPDCPNAASLDALRNDWKADLFRIAMYVQEGGFETDPAGFTKPVIVVGRMIISHLRECHLEQACAADPLVDACRLEEVPGQRRAP